MLINVVISFMCVCVGEHIYRLSLRLCDPVIVKIDNKMIIEWYSIIKKCCKVQLEEYAVKE